MCETPVEKTLQPNSSQYFTEITKEVGLDFTHENGADGSLRMPEIMAGGVALFDSDGDSDLDIYFTNGHHGLGTRELSNGPVNRLFRLEDDGTFADATEESGLGDRGYGMGVATGDMDNDGDTDVYVSNIGHDRLYRNRGDGTYEDVTQSAGIDIDGWSASTSFLDYDRDGYLDLFVVRYVKWDPKKDCFSRSGKPDYCGPLSFVPDNDVLLHNNGDGTFTDVSQAAGIAQTAAAGLGIVCEDFNDDGWIDVYITNDAYANNLWINQGDGTFLDDALMLGAAYNMHGHTEAGMGLIAGDFDNDGDPDLFMTHLGQESNTLLVNNGALMGFNDATSSFGLGWSSVPYTGFGLAAFDLEMDGDLDIFLVNGRVYLKEPVPGSWVLPPWNRMSEPNLFYTNDGTGKFDLLEESVESLCSPIEITRGVASGDIDTDGDVDIVIVNLRSSARLYRNDTPRKGHWLSVRAKDPRLNRDALGARIIITCGERRFSRTISSGFSYMSSSEPQAHFGLGPVSVVDSIHVRWPDGLFEEFAAVSPNQVVKLVRGEGETREYESSQRAQVASVTSGN
ncbi:MAG: CRTAC1 family protein [Phycisphaerales bacterium]|nr:MAG: CRTAC1 family protein [Phycisphaerales bacterium]